MSFPIISSNTLFHFTNKREYLINILTNDFRPRYCLENYKFGLLAKSGTFFSEFAFPMTCFCDIPLSNIHKHLETYGNYGIGLTKEWGKRNGLNPILYVNEESNLLKSLDYLGSALAKSFKREGKVEFDNKSRAIKGLINVRFYYLKPYEGIFKRNGRELDVRFYDEREWRYIPEPLSGEYYQLEKTLYDDSNIQQKECDSLPESATLKFTPDDIRYIIAKTAGEILEMVDEIMDLKGDHYTANQVKLLQTRIISAEQIREDF